ncbi:MAG TPA: endonuclease domain-containing protein [Patescibacteria group bacterium]|nr:endonuclease domain-containing protein [Patescibacteria group bacterium]
MNSKIKIYTAREFRKNLTKSEKILWGILRNKRFGNLKFRRQHILEGYIVDFYCDKLKLVIEIDGDIHLKQVHEDKIRQKTIEEKGIKFIRITAREVEGNINSVLDKLKSLAPLPLNGRGGRGEGGKSHDW